MRIIRALLAASAGSLLFAGAVTAQTLAHTTTVRLPDGSVEHIRYAGDVPPRLTFVSPSPFATLDRIADEMNREADAMMRGVMPAGLLPFADDGQMFRIDMNNLRPGASGYEVMVSVSPGNKVCTESMTITSSGRGAKPHVVTQHAGNCGVLSTNSPMINAPFMTPPAPPTPTPVISVRADAPHRNAAPIREASLQNSDR